MSGSALGGRYRQNRHHLHRISWEDREVRMVLEELGGSTMRIRPNDCVGAHQVGYILNAVLAHLLGLTEGTPHPDNCGIMLFGPGFPSRDSLLHLRPTNFLGKRVPSCHPRACLAAEENREKGIIRAHAVHFSAGRSLRVSAIGPRQPKSVPPTPDQTEPSLGSVAHGG